MTITAHSSVPLLVQQDVGAYIDDLDDSRSLLNAARFAPSDFSGWPDQELLDETATSRGHSDGTAASKAKKATKASQNVSNFASDALSTLKHIQGLINQELGRHVRVHMLLSNCQGQLQP